ncbi:hypothetical protein JB92DRAFT_1729395 [Gautieria morchelliformis]|nr:hypothetical protein JB92DRAFT_1729395 [Gautieria morchelliformis]
MPTVTLDTDEITQEMAARLTIALLGQILYMKGQVPFPVASLVRMVDRQSTENASRAAIRAEKSRIEFLDSYDDLRSHLRTTFVALSTALANDETAYPACSTTAPFHTPRRRPAKIHIFLVLGPSPSAAKARYLLELDGFRVERFGEWQYSRRDRDHAPQQRCSNESKDGPVGSGESISSPRPPSRPTTPRTTTSQPLDDWDSPFSSSSGTSYDAVSVPGSPSVTSGSSISDEGPSECREGLSERLTQSILEQRVEASLRTGERLLVRTLFADHEGLGFGDEICECRVFFENLVLRRAFASVIKLFLLDSNFVVSPDTSPCPHPCPTSIHTPDVGSTPELGKNPRPPNAVFSGIGIVSRRHKNEETRKVWCRSAYSGRARPMSG